MAFAKTLHAAAETLAEHIDTLREQFIVEGADDSVIAKLHEAAVLMWDVVTEVDLDA